MSEPSFEGGGWIDKNFALVTYGEPLGTLKVTKQALKSLEEREDFIFEKLEGPQQKFVEALEKSSHFGLWGERHLVEYHSDKPLLKEEFAALEKFLEAPPEDNILILRLPDLDKKLANKIKARCLLLECTQIKKRADINIWLLNEAKKRNLRLNANGAWELIDKVGLNLGALENSLTLMELSSRASGLWDRPQVEEFFFRDTQKNVFNLAESISAGKLPASLKMANGILDRGIGLVELMGGLRVQFRRLLQLNLHQSDWTREEALKQTHITPYFYQKTKTLADSYSVNKLKKIYAELYNLDRDSKMSAGRDRDLLEMFIYKVILK